MTAASDLKRGDRVRIVFEGEMLWPDVFVVDDIFAFGDTPKALRLATSIEVLPPPVPEWSEREGAVCLDKWGCAWQYDDDKWRDVRHSFTPGIAPQTYADLLEARGPLTLLHDPLAGVVDAVIAPYCDTCNDTGEVHFEAQPVGIHAMTAPCPDCQSTP